MSLSDEVKQETKELAELIWHDIADARVVLMGPNGYGAVSASADAALWRAQVEIQEAIKQLSGEAPCTT